MEHLQWRYATKKFDSTRKVSEADLAELLECLRLAPSSFGLQPWKFVVISDLEIRKKIQPHAWNQAQITEASHLIVMCVIKSMTSDYVRNYLQFMAKERSISLEVLSGLEGMILGLLQKQTPEEQAHWLRSQVYLALGVLMSECARKKIDSCPMEGFEPAQIDELLKLDPKGLKSVVLCPIGYRASDDKYAGLKKIRFSKEDVLIRI